MFRCLSRTRRLRCARMPNGASFAEFGAQIAAIPGVANTTQPIFSILTSIPPFVPSTEGRVALSRSFVARSRWADPQRWALSDPIPPGLRTPNPTRLQRLAKPRDRCPTATPDYDVFCNTGFCGTIPHTKALSNSAIELNFSVRKWWRISSQRWHLVLIFCQAAWNNGQHSCWTWSTRNASIIKRARAPPTGSAPRVRNCVPGDTLGSSRC